MNPQISPIETKSLKGKIKKYHAMKKIAILSLLFILSLAASAQGIYTKKTKYDKFDDVVWTKNVKTLITKYNDSIVFETKGQQPETFLYVEEEYLALHIGDRDNMENIVSDLYGYETQYIVFPKSMMQEVISEFEVSLEELDSDDEKATALIALALLSKLDETPTVTFRTISSNRYYFDYRTDLVWIKYPDGSRIIYEK